MTTTRTIALAAAAVLPAAALAQASGLQIYGRIDLSANNVRIDGVGSRNTVSSDASWLGFRGSEDLGGGLAAFFKAETLVNADTGATGGTLNLGNGAVPVAPTPTGQFFNREVYVGLRSARWGALSLGAHFAPAITLTARTDPFGRAMMGSQAPLLQGPQSRGYALQLVNSLQYATPAWNGFSARVMLQAHENTFNRNRAALLEYQGGRFYAGMAWDSVQANLSGAALGVPPGARLTNLGLGASYRFDAVKVLGYVQHNDADGLADARGYNLGVQVPVGNGEIRASWVRAANPGRQATLWAVGYEHLLSRRTQVYATLARLDNGAGARSALWPALQDGVVPTAPGQDARGIQVGIRHVF